jgi:type I restriction enzyme, S subunit
VSDLHVTPIAKLAEVRSGSGAPQDPSAFSRDGHPFVRAGSLSRLLAGDDENRLEKIVPDIARTHRLQLFPKGTVLFAKSGMSATKGYIYNLKQPAYVVSHLAALVPRDPRDSSFLKRALQRFSPTSLIKDPAYPSIRLGDIERMEILAPVSVEGRERIAAILDKADAMSSKCMRSLNLLNSLSEAMFLEIFGEMTEDSAGHPIVPFAELVDSQRIGLVRSANELHEDAPTPYLRMNAITIDGQLDLDSVKRTKTSAAELAEYQLIAGDFLFNTRNSKELVGKTAVFHGPKGYVYNNNILRVRFGKQLLPEYAAAFFQTQFARRELEARKSGTTSVFAIYQKSLETFPVALPPIQLQRHFVERINRIEEAKRKSKKQEENLKSLFVSLQHRAFSGELE